MDEQQASWKELGDGRQSGLKDEVPLVWRDVGGRGRLRSCLLSFGFREPLL